MISTMIEWTIEAHETGLFPLEWLYARLPAAPSGYLRQLLRSGRILNNGAPLDPRTRLREGDRLRLPESRRLQELTATSGPGLAILCETREALIVAKPAGLAVHRGEGHEADNLTERVQTLLRLRGTSFQCAPIHRLDAETSGPVLFGKGRAAIAAFGKVFMHQPVTKLYLGLVGAELPATGLLTSTVPVRGRPRESATAFRSLGHGGGFSLVEFRLLTGRRHQIRRQLADSGQPLAGDRRYGGPTAPGLARLFLHCSHLEVPNPFGETVLMATCALPEALASVLRQLGIAPPAAPECRDMTRPA